MKGTPIRTTLSAKEYEAIWNKVYKAKGHYRFSDVKLNAQYEAEVAAAIMEKQRAQRAALIAEDRRRSVA